MNQNEFFVHICNPGTLWFWNFHWTFTFKIEICNTKKFSIIGYCYDSKDLVKILSVKKNKKQKFWVFCKYVISLRPNIISKHEINTRLQPRRLYVTSYSNSSICLHKPSAHSRKQKNGQTPANHREGTVWQVESITLSPPAHTKWISCSSPMGSHGEGEERGAFSTAKERCNQS